MQLQRDRLEIAAVAQVLDREQLAAQLDRRPERVRLGHGPPHHQLDDLGHGHIGDVLGRDPLTVAQDGDAVTDLLHLVEMVADEEDADALSSQLADDGEELVCLARGERRGGLVEDEQPGLGQERAGDLDHLHLGDAEVLDRRVGRHVQSDVGHQPLGSLAHHSPVDEAVIAGQRLERQVLLDGQVGQEIELLVHDPDTGLDGLLRIVREVALAVEQHLAAIGLLDAGEHLDQRRLAGTVLTDEGVDLTRAGRSG